MTAMILLKDWQESQIEMWRPIEGYAGYEVSNFGNVRSFRTRRSGQGSGRATRYVVGVVSMALRQYPTWQGYMRAYLYRPKGGRKCAFVHRLVATAFLPNPTSLPEVNHLTALKSDCRVGNLEWASTSTNHKHACANGLGNKLNADKVRQIRKRLADGDTQASIARDYGVSRPSISNIKSGKQWYYVT